MMRKPNGMQINQTIAEFPVNIASFGGLGQKIPVKRRVATGQSPFIYGFHPNDKIFDELLKRFFIRIGNLGFRKADNPQRLLINRRSIPHSAFSIELILRIIKIQSSDAYYRVPERIKPCCFNVNYNHILYSTPLWKLLQKFYYCAMAASIIDLTVKYDWAPFIGNFFP